MKIMQGMTQGDAAWLAHRSSVRNASDAPAMMGASPYVSRSELVRRYATGIVPDVDARTQAIFDRGHEVEPALRALAESMIGEDLYPVIGVSDDGYLGASFDGVTMGEDVIFEAKQSNAEKMAIMDEGGIPPADHWQIVQQFAVCESAQRCYYLVGDGTQERTAWLAISRKQIESDIPKLLAGWRQFDADVAAYVPDAEVLPLPAGKAPDQLPALRVEVTGQVTASNLAVFRETALAVIGSINTDLQTDEDFASAEKTVKWCADVEDRIKAAKQHALSQTASIDELFRTMDAIAEETRSKRLELDKLVKQRKEAIRSEIAYAGRDAITAHYETMNTTLGSHAIPVPSTIGADLNAAIKGKRTVTSIRDAVDGVVANAKIAASHRADAIRACIAVMDECAKGHESLFADRVALCASKAPDDLRNLVKLRIADHEAAQKAKAEADAEAAREKIRAEEEAKLRAEQAAEQAKASQGVESAAPKAAEVVTSRPASVVQSAPSSGYRAPTKARPADASIIEALTRVYAVDSATVVEWLRTMDLDAASRALAA